MNGSINAVKKTRSTEQARKEAEFQRAIANGMSYEDQIAFREKQLDEEKGSSFSDTEYISKLEKSVTDTKKLSRFNKYRTRYAELVTELSAGKINEQSYLESLRTNLNGVNDEDLRLEIQNDIVAATQKVKEYQDTILANQIKKAKYDGTQSALNDAISRVNSARMQALISENDDEVTAYDETLAALNGQLSTTKIQDSITDFQVRSITRGVNPTEKLNFINNEIQKADPNVAVKIGDRTYANAQQFWTLERDNFLAGNSQVFGDFFSELKTTAENAVNANAAKFGYPTQVVLDQTLSYFNDLRAKPEIAPFVGKLDITQATVMAEAVDKLSKTVNDIATNNLSFKEGDVQLQNIARKYGIDTSGYRIDLQNKSLQISEPEEGLIPEVNLELPKVGETPSTPAAPGVTPAPSITPQSIREVKAGDTLSRIATESNVTLAQLLEANPKYKENPNLIRPGEKVNIPGATPITPTPTPTVTPAPAEKTPAPTPAPVVTPTPTPTSTPAVVPPVTPTPTTPAPTAPVPSSTSTYQIISGDTLSGIAAKYGTTVEELARINQIVDPNKIKAGATIKLK